MLLSRTVALIRAERRALLTTAAAAAAAAATPRVLRIGDAAEVPRRFSAEEVALFAKISGDNNPLHIDEAFARTTRFQRCIVHGVLLNGYVV